MPKAKSQVLWLWAHVMLLPAVAQAQTNRYVETGGSDSGSCTSLITACETVSYALAQADSGDIIRIGSGTFTEPDGLLIEISISLRGQGDAGPDATVLQADPQPGNANDRVIAIQGNADVSISNLSIENGALALFPGGGIYHGGDDLDLSNVTLRNNHAPVGGGLAVDGIGDVVLLDVYFDSNHASLNGGGMHIYGNTLPSASLSFIDTFWVDNQADSHGGGISIDAGVSAEFEDARFISNTANQSGGGIFATDASLQLSNGTFTANQAGLNGGAIASSGSNMMMTGYTIGSNSAGQNGGGVYLDQAGTVSISTTNFVQNEASLGGGIFNNNGSSPTLTDVLISDNLASVHGGGLLNNTGSQPLLTRVEIINNTSSLDGGGMYNNDSSPIIRNARFHLNESSTRNGGGLHNINQSSPTIINTVFSFNFAPFGAGVYNIAASMPELINTTLTRNEASQLGGGVLNVNSSASMLHNSIVWGNLAGAAGDNLHNHDASSSASLVFSLYGNEPGNVTIGGGIDCIQCLTGDPRLVNPDGLLFQLIGDSPARNAGDPFTDLSLFPGGPVAPVDLGGSPRVLEGRVDMGAYEFELNETFFVDSFED